jgi:hypothetical protein
LNSKTPLLNWKRLISTSLLMTPARDGDRVADLT